MKLSVAFTFCALLLSTVVSAPAGQVIISELMYNPVGTKAEWIEVTNVSTNRFDMAKWQLQSGATITLPDFSAGTPTAHFFLEKERILLSSKSPANTRLDYPNIPAGTRIYGPWTGLLDNGGETIRILDKNGARLCELSYSDGGRFWPAAPDGTGHSLVVVNENKTLNDPKNWRTSPAQGGSPGSTDIVLAEELVPNPTTSTSLEAVSMASTWSFYKEVAAPPANWNALGFTPTAPWGSGPALLGFETAALPSPGLQTAMQTGVPASSTNLLTYYLRQNFNWTGGTAGANFEIDTILDDGATFYINGVYIGNKDGVANPVHNTSVATATVGDATLVTNSVTGGIPAGLLVDGVNTFAAVCFNVSLSSSDLIFGANLRLANPGTAEVMINEVRQAGPGLGFIEFYNPGVAPINLNGYYLTDTVGVWTKYLINQSVVLSPGGVATLGFTEMGFSATATTTTIYLSKPNGTPMTGFVANLPQDGRSLTSRPSGSNTWYRTTQPSPGTHASSPVSNTAGANPLLNEVHFNATTGRADWVEVTNASTGAQNLSGLFVASTKTFSDKVALSGSLAVNGFASANVDFEVSANGNLTIYLIDAGNRVLGEAEVERKPGKSCTQAWPRGANEWYATATPTRDAVNVPDRNTSIVISEIMFAPPSEHRQGEYLELTNRSAAPVNVGGWNFTAGISYTIPVGTTIAAGGRLVVAENPDYITANYPGAGAVVGGYGGSLSNSGELIRLLDTTGNLADEVDYNTGGDWPRLADSLGSSLELINVAMDNDVGSSWAASNETAKGQWTSFTYSGLWHNLGNGGTDTERRELHFNLVGDGHIVLRNVNFGVSNQALAAIPNTLSPTNSGADGWQVTGTHWASFADAEGLHIVADGAGDMKGNAIERDVTMAPQITTPFTITFEARWVSGMSRLVMETWDRTWGRTFAVPVPNGLGTPGTVNSRAGLTSPEIWSMLHSPVLPKATDDVKITARVSSALPIASVSVVHRLDSVAGTNAWTTSAMNDTGTAGDEVAGDGIFTATLTAYKTEGVIAQFYIQAAATGGGTTTYPAGGVLTPGMWIVDTTPVTSDLLVQRFIMSQRDHDSLNTASGATATHNYRHPRMSNHYYNTTLILNEKEIIYNVESRKSGSPWTRDGGNSMDRVRTKFPKDRMFRGREKTGADNDANLDVIRRWNNRLDRYWLYLLDYPAAEAEFVQVQFNNLGLSLKDDTEPTDTDMLDRTYENSGSTELHEIDDSWYFSDNLLSTSAPPSVNGDWVVDARWLDSPVYWQGSWPIRTQMERYDFGPITSWIRTMYNNNTSPTNDSPEDAIYRASVEKIFDVDKFGRYAAVKGWAGAWDNFTIDRGKNGFVYKRPTDGRWEFEFWDGDLDFQAPATRTILGGIPGTAPFFTRPWMRRSMNYYLQEIRDQWSLNSPRMNAWLQAMEDQSPSYNIDQNYYKTWFNDRRSTVDAFIGTGNQTIALSATASVGANTTANFTNLSGNAPSNVATITVDGHPEGVFTWVNAAAWQMTGLYLRSGTNTLTVRTWDRLGAALGTTSLIVNKTGDAPPVLKIVSDPESLNASLGEAVVVDSTGSFDPEGLAALTLTWTVSPLTGVTNTASGLTGRRLLFSVPGIYTVTLNGLDGAGSSSSLSREIAIYATSDFSSFGSSLLLTPGLTAENTELRDNFSGPSWFSLEDISGRLQIQINESAAATVDSGNFPAVTRQLPLSADWVMQTDVHLETRHRGEFFNAGLLLDMLESGTAIRYLYGWETGDQIRFRRDDAATVYNPGGAPPTPDTIRINCGGPTVTELDNLVWQADSNYLSTPTTTTVSQTYNPTVGGASQYFGIIGDTRRSGVAGDGITYEIPVPAWSYNYDVTLYSSVVSVTAQTISMQVVLNDVAPGTTFNANSSNTIMRTAAFPNVARSSSGTIKITITRNAGTTAGVEVGISAIQIKPIPAPTPVGGALPALPPAPMQADAIRIQRTGNILYFARQVNGAWIVDRTQSIPVGSTTVKGGVFASTETPMNLRAAFDYLLIADPAKAATVLASLRLTEVMYNPASPGVEYLEFQNTGPAPLNLQGVNLPAGIPFAAYTFGNETLAAGEFIVLTGNPAGFRAKYSVAPRLAVTSWLSGALDNGGERIIVNDPTGNPIHDFTYDDVPAWPITPDGQGPSLEIIDYQGDYNNPLNWRASASPDGTPGGTTRLTDPDTDGDGIPDWVEAAFGLGANTPGQKPLATTTMNAGQVTISWPFAAGRSYVVECSTDLVFWEAVATITDAGSFQDPSSLTNVRRYYRVTAQPYP